MFGNASKYWSIGFRRTTPFGDEHIPWRFWVGPLLITGHPSVGWTRAA